MPISIHELITSGTERQIDDAKAGDYESAVMALRNGREAIHRVLNNASASLPDHDRVSLSHLLHCLLRFASTDEIESAFYLERGRGAPKKVSRVRQQAYAREHMRTLLLDGVKIGKAEERTAERMGISKRQVQTLTRGIGTWWRQRIASAK